MAKLSFEAQQAAQARKVGAWRSRAGTRSALTKGASTGAKQSRASVGTDLEKIRSSVGGAKATPENAVSSTVRKALRLGPARGPIDPTKVKTPKLEGAKLQPVQQFAATTGKPLRQRAKSYRKSTSVVDRRGT